MKHRQAARRGPGLAPVAAASAYAALRALVTELQQALQGLFVQRTAAPLSEQPALQQRLLLGLELMWKIEEQVLLPALQPWACESAPAVGASPDRELTLMRDLSQLVSTVRGDERELTLGVLEGLATMHFAGMDALLEARRSDAGPSALGATAACASRPPRWQLLRNEIVALLERWQAEVQASGSIEDDEDADPVGPRPGAAGLHAPAPGT